MMLPKIDKPTFKFTLPIAGTKIVYTPYTVKEEKILLIAMQSQEPDQILHAVKQIINNCVVSPKSFDSGKINLFDLELLIILLRVVSTSNTSTITYLDKEDDKKYSFEIDLQKLVDDASKLPVPDKKVKISESLGIVMKDLSVDMFNGNGALIDLTNPDNQINLLGDCIDKIYEVDGEKVWLLSDHTKEEKEEFLESFDRNASNAVGEYFAAIPKLTYEVKWKNKKGTERVVTLQGLSDFFQ